MSAPPDEPGRLMHRGQVPGTVRGLGLVSFLTDVASDMIVPLLPLFLTGTLNASNSLVGLIDGAGETASSVLKLLSGRLSDALPRRKPLVVAGYLLAALARPLVAVATLPWHVLAVRVADRTGKGVRTAPRDAWIAESCRAEERATAYGFHRRMDNAGAFTGPLVGLLLYRALDLPLRWVFALAAAPGLLAVLVLLFIPEETAATGATSGSEQVDDARGASAAHAGPANGREQPRLPRTLKLFLAALLLFTLANASDFFLILRARDAGLTETGILLAWTGLQGLKAFFNMPGSRLSDRLGRRRTLLLGWCLYGAVYLGLSLSLGPVGFLVLLVGYAGYYGLTEGTERALVADLAPAPRRGLAFGLFHGTIGLAALPASAGFGAIADATSLETAFGLAGLLALLAAGLLALVRLPPGPRAERSAGPPAPHP